MREYQPPPSRPERERRQDEMRPGAVAADGKPVELNGEHIEQQDADDELRRGHADETQDHDGVVGSLAALDRGENAGRQADQQFAADRPGHQQQGCRQPRQDQFGDFGLLDVGAAEIALQKAHEIAEILLMKRQMQAKLLADVLDRLRGRAAAGDLARRIGRQQEQQIVGDQRNAEQDQTAWPIRFTR